MAVKNEEERSPLDPLGSEAQRALKERPSFSIRTKISIWFILLFFLSFGITITSVVMLVRIQGKLVFVESAESYMFEIQQARRFEKNYFLYGTNLEDALSHVHNAQQVLQASPGEMASVVGTGNFETMLRHIRRYEELLGRLAHFGSKEAVDYASQRDQIEEELRRHGAEIVNVAEQLVTKERESINTMLLISQRISILFIPLLLALIIYVTNFIARQMLQPLNRLMAATRRIAEGDFTPITPRRRYRDEFSELAMAMNHMIYQLAHRQEMLVQAHKLKAVGTLTAGVAHELNNPINNIMITAAILQEDYRTLSDDEKIDMAKDLVDQAQRSQKIVRNLLDFARESEMKTELLQVKDLIEEVLRLASNQIKLSKVKLIRNYAANLPAIHGDKAQLNQVFLNIVLNAMDAMPKGGALNISTGLTQEYLTVEISDSGAGIPEHILPSIFDPFFTTKATGKGTGLGLSVSLGIIRKHGGDIRVRSRINEGTAFAILLPAAKVPAKISSSS
jgi:two-component system NtrC family sensor kinase